MKSPTFFALSCLIASGCAGAVPLDDGGTGGTSGGSGGASSTGGATSSGGASSGGAASTGGNSSSGGASTGGGFGTGGAFGTGGGFFGTGGGFFGTGGGFGSGGAGSGGAGSGGAGSGGAGPVEIDCDAQMPTSGGMDHSSSNQQGGSGNTAWSIWTNGGPGQLTTYGSTPAFRAAWNNSGDYLGRMGFEWGGSGKQYTEYGTITADYVWNKAPGSNPGVAGGYSYLGVYGWSNDPCVEWYIVEDSFHQMPFNTGDQPVGTTEIDGGVYNLVYRVTPGTGGNRCDNGESTWEQFYSIRLEGKRCGTITISDHFAAWAERGWDMGRLLEIKIVVEAAAGNGYVDFPLARVSTTMDN